MTHGLGPVMGLFALPFWPLGPEAAFNGAILVGFVLTGYFLYLLAWEWGCTRPVAFFAGLMLLVAPIHLSGLYGHIEKTFVGLLPLGLLLTGRALHTDGRKGWLWSTAAAFVSLLSLLHNGHQFVFLASALAFLLILTWYNESRETRRVIGQRAIRLGLLHLLIAGPMILLILQASNAPGITRAVSQDASLFQPALVEFFIPSGFSWLLGQQVRDFMNLPQQVETAVSLSWTGLVLALIALIYGPVKARQWLVFLLLIMFLALGPSLRLVGDRFLTWQGEAVPMPFAFLAYLPGLDFMRTPGRYMFIGYVAFAFAAALGLQWLLRRYPRQAALIFVLASSLVLLESWPAPWPQEALLPVSPFYQQLVNDEAEYGVFDLPVLPTPFNWQVNFGSFYQVEQMTHQKGIAYGYISRIYEIHPFLPCLFPETMLPQDDLLVNGQPSPCYEQVEATLAYYNYRYVVWHKPENWQPWGYEPGSWGEQQAADLVTHVFADRVPFYEDKWVTVYEVDSNAAAHLRYKWVSGKTGGLTKANCVGPLHPPSYTSFRRSRKKSP